jgi:Na+/H+ antiporter NhaD/arsenite permease-like protein
MPYLFAEFFAANICSLVLLIGNPTNIIVGEANHLTFADYSMWMIAVAFVSTATAFFVLYYIFRSELNRTFVPPELDPQAALKDKRAAIVHSVVLICTLLSLSVAPWMHAPLWVICAIAASIVFVYNSCQWPWTVTLPTISVDLENGSVNTGVTKSKNELSPMKMDSEKSRLLDNPHDGSPVHSRSASSIGGSIDNEKVQNPFGDNTPMPTLKKSLEMLPWRILPFVFGMFTLVEGMRKSGWIDSMAESLVSCIPAEGGPLAIFVSSYLMTCVTILLSNLINNQPATILLTRVIISPGFLALPEAVRSVGMFGVILGSNLGANFTLIGALAGIMFAKILSEKGIILGYVEFAKQGFKVMPLVTALSAGVLFLEHLSKA